MLLKKSNPDALPGASPERWWLRTVWGNGLVVVAVSVAALIGYLLEYSEQNFTIPWFAQSLTLMMIAIGVIMAVSLQLINGVSGQFSLGHAGFMAIGAYLSGYASSTYNALDPQDPATHYQNVGQIFWYFVCMGVIVAAVGAVLAILFLGVQQSRRIARWLPPLLMIGVLVWFTWDFSTAFNLDSVPSRFVWTHLIRGFLTTFDWTLAHGLPYAKAVSLWIPTALRRPICFLVLLAGGGFFAAAGGLLVGLPTLRLRGDYLAIATLGFAQILIVVFTNCKAVGGATGLQVDPFANPANPDRDPVAHYIFPWVLAFTVITVAVVWRIAYSPKGRMIRAVREDEIAAAAVGINATRQKVTAFVVGAFFAGIAGVLYVHSEGSAQAEQTFGIDKSLLYVIMVTLGGLGSISGAVVSGALLSFLPYIFRQAASSALLPKSVRAIFENQLALFAAVLVVMMLLRPTGLLGGYELWWRRKSRKRSEAAGVPASAFN